MKQLFFCIIVASLWLLSDVSLFAQDISEMGMVTTHEAQKGVLQKWVISRGPFRNYQPDKTHLEHGRHQFKHAAVMPTEKPSSERFATSRKSDVVLNLPKEDDAFTFVIFGDRTSGNPEELSVLADAVHDTNLLEPDFVITVGDMVMGYNVTEQWKQEATLFSSTMAELTCPWFPVVGNHDMQWRGPNPPKNFHEKDYEKHFGPAWYAFEHKNCWFIALFTDESDEKGKKSYSTPKANTMSDVQLQWLKETLKQAGKADHVFLFMHHPRWMNHNPAYKNVWDPVHKLLVEAGNVTAVFAGHIHCFTAEKRDGIEYLTLSTTGGRLNHVGVPRIGYLHNFFQITVRKDRLGIAALPVGASIDPRTIRQEIRTEIQHFASTKFSASPTIVVAANGAVKAFGTLPVHNTTSLPLNVVATLASEDSRWEMTTHPWTFRLEPGARQNIPFSIARKGGSMDSAFRVPIFKLNIECPLGGKIVAFPEIVAEIPLDLKRPMQQSEAAKQAVLRLCGNGDRVVLPSVTSFKDEKSLTLETWFQAETTSGLATLISKGKESDFALTLEEGVPQFHVPLGVYHYLLSNPKIKVQPNRWYHLAGVYDAGQLRLYLDGKLIAQETMEGEIGIDASPFILGAEKDRDGNFVYSFNGSLDSVRLSQIARYTDESFSPQRDFQHDADTLLLLDMQRSIGRLTPLVEGKGYGEMVGDAKIGPVTNH